MSKSKNMGWHSVSLSGKVRSAWRQNSSAEETLRLALKRFGRARVAFATSFGAEDQVITDMLVKIDPDAKIFTLDTGWLPAETDAVLKKTVQQYGISLEILKARPDAVKNMVREHGANLFYDSVEKRKLCCHVRKVEPLKKKLAALKAWICGLRAGQSVTRAGAQKIEWDEVFGLYKINPLADWTETRVWEYIKNNNVPYNELHDRGYPSIGCSPCTRAIKPGEDTRAGRWWWERPEQKECGLHIKDGKLARRDNGSS